MDRRRWTGYLWSLPERVLRSLAALAAGLVREAGEVALPLRVRRSRLYYALVDSTLRFLIEEVGRVEGAYAAPEVLPKDFLVRRAAGNVIEMAGLVAFRASPVWVLAALADLSGVGRDLIAEIADALAEDGLLERGRRFETVDQLLDGLERTAGQLAETVNTPPLDIAGLRAEWAKLRDQVRRAPDSRLPRAEALREDWSDIRSEAERQERSVFEISSAMAVSAIRRLPENVRWLSRAARSGARRTGEVVAGRLLDHYRDTLAEIRETGYARYWLREFRPYLDGALANLSPEKSSLTERFIAGRRSATRRNFPGVGGVS
jgi:hypothetical protein